MQSDGADIRPLADDSDSDIEQSTENLGLANLQLRVVLDTNILWVDSASDLVRREVATLLKGSIFPDVTILWYLPDVVLHERQYQMQRKALELYPSVTKIERLLGQQLNTTKDAFLKRVETVVVEACHRLGILTLDLDTKRVEWQRLIGKALYRKPPFQEGENEKGFRDSLVAEAFLQLVASPAEPPHLCRTVFVTSEKLLAATVRGDISTPSAAVLSGIGELTGLINTLIANVDERFIARLQAKAAKLFFVSGERKDTLYLGGHLKTGHRRSPQNRPTGRGQDLTLLYRAGGRRGKKFLIGVADPLHSGYTGFAWAEDTGNAGMRPERRPRCRNGGAASSRPRS